MTTEQELNEKLAKWAGFTKKEYEVGKPPHQLREYYWLTPKELPVYEIPNFTQSLDTCFLWLEPKFPFLVLENYQAGFRIEVSLDMKSKGVACDKSASLALCRAIEKLIDKEQVAKK